MARVMMSEPWEQDWSKPAAESKPAAKPAAKPWEKEWKAPAKAESKGPAETSPKTSRGGRIAGNAAAVGDVVAGIPGAVAGTAVGTFDYFKELIGARGEQGMKGALPTDTRRAAASHALGAGQAVAEAFPTTGMFSRLMKHFGYGDEYDQSAVNEVMQKGVPSLLAKGTKGLEELAGKDSKGGQAFTSEEAELVANISMLMAPAGVGRFLKGKRGLVPKAELAAGKTSSGTAAELLKQYEAEGGEHAPKLTADKLRQLSDADINAEQAAYDLMKRGASRKEVLAARKRNPLVGTKLDEFMARRQEVRQGPMSTTLQGEVLPPRSDVPAGTGASPKGPVTVENTPTPKLAAPLGKQAGAADPRLLAKVAAVGGGVAAGAYADQDKLEGAIAGGLAGLVSTQLPRFVASVKDNWKSTLAPVATTAGVSAGLAALDKEHPVEGALLGLAWGARKLLPKAQIPQVGNMTIDELTNLRNGNIAAKAREVSIVSGGIRTLVADPARRAAVAAAVEAGTERGLSADEVKAARIYKGFTRAYADAAKSAGVLDDFVQNYVTHIVEKEGLPKSKIGEVLASLGFGQAERTGGTSASSNFSKHRKYATFGELQKALEGSGLKLKTQDLADIADIYGRSMNRTIENRRYVEALKAAKEGGEGGKPFIMAGEKAPPNYVQVNSPQLRGQLVHPEIADAVKFVMEQSNPNAVTKGLLAMALAQKRLSTGLSLFHASNLGNAFVAATGRGPLYAKQAIDAALKAYKEGGLGDTTDLLLKGGLKIAEGRPEEFDARALTKVGEFADQLVERTTGLKSKLAGKALGAVEDLQVKTFDKLTWDYLHTGMKLAVGTRELERLTLKHPDLAPAEVARQVSSFVNDTFGGLDWYRVATETESAFGRKMAMAALAPAGRRAMQIGMFAPDWTFSTFRAMYKALPGADKMPLTKELHQRYMLRTAVLYATLMNGINMQTSGHSILENKDPTKIEYKDGTTQQVAKHAMEGYEWLLKPRQTALNKLGPLIKEPLEQLTDKEYLNAEGAAPPITSRIGHAARAALPIPLQQSGVEGRSAGEAAKRAGLSLVGTPLYGMTKEEKQATREKRARDRRLKELRK